MVRLQYVFLPLVFADPPGYVCTNQTDISGASCDIGRYGHCGGKGTPCDVNELASLCDGMRDDECNGFNSNGYLKRCVRSSCGARVVGSYVTVCVRSDVPEDQSMPAGCKTTTSTKSTTHTTTSVSQTCSGHLPPFSLPSKEVLEVDDWHNPPEEAAEVANLIVPTVVSVGSDSATLLDQKSGETAIVVTGSVFQNWSVSTIMGESGTVVLEQLFNRWGSFTFVKKGESNPLSIRKPVGRLASLQQPTYHLNETDPDWYCKQDKDGQDWLGKIAAGMSNGEPTFTATSSIFAPNVDDVVFGNPEELCKWILRSDGRVKTQDFPRGRSKSGGHNVLYLKDYLPPTCPQSGSHGHWESSKAGMIGRHLRAAEMGFWDTDSSCGATIMVVSPQTTAENPVSTALVRITTVHGTNESTVHLRLLANQTTSEPLSTETLPDGALFFAAILQQVDRWDKFVGFGAQSSIPDFDRRYRDMPNALLTAYLNTFRGMTPEYGMGKFANEYNEFLPLDTLSLHEGLLEWGHHDVSRQYLSHFFGTDKYINSTDGKIIYSVFGCDGDADYGRLISTFVKASRYSGDLEWASSLLPVIEKMAGVMLQMRQQTLDTYNSSSLLYGLALGSPEHDLCGGKSFFFNVNVWMIRGLSDLHQFLQETSLSHNATLEKELAPIIEDWRDRLEKAAAFTLVRRESDGSPFFLHPCVGSDCAKRDLVLKPGGTDETCIIDGTCWPSMTADRSNQLANYANFRFYSETLLASVLSEDYEDAIISFRDTHRGTLAGMTRFRDGLDDMPILGYGWGLLTHNKVGLFHTLLAGHSANYLSRGTHWGTEQRQQQQHGGVLDNRWTNNCGDGGEDCSLCMVSSMPPAMWIRWMLVQEHRDLPYVHLARGAPKRWFMQEEPFGIQAAPTRFGVVSYQLRASDGGIDGSITLAPHPTSQGYDDVLYTVRLMSPVDKDGGKLSTVQIKSGSAMVVSIDSHNNTVTFKPSSASSSFDFTASFSDLVTMV